MAKYRHILVLLAFSLLVGAFFGGTISHGFNSDDYLVIYHAIYRASESPLEGMTEFIRPSWGLYYRPIIKLFFEGSAEMFGLSAGGYHFISLMLYAILCFEVYLIALCLKSSWRGSVMAGLVFMTASAHAQPLFWISCLNGVVENVLTLAVLIFFILWRSGEKKHLHFTSLCFFALALLTKESAIALPLIIVGYDFLLGGDSQWQVSIRRTLKGCWSFVLVAGLFVLMRHIVMRQIEQGAPLTSFSPGAFIRGLWRVFVMTLSPIDWNLAAYLFNKVLGSGLLSYIIMLICLLVIAALPLIFRKKRIAFLIWWIIAGASPFFALGLIPSERHVVISSAASAILISIVIFRLADLIMRKESRASLTLAYAVIAVFIASNLFAIKKGQDAWKKASNIADSVIKQTTSSFISVPANETFFFLNVPDSYDGAFALRFENITYALRLYYDDHSLQSVRAITLDKIPSPALSSWESAYFVLGAGGGNIYAPVEHRDNPKLAKRWSRLGELDILRRDYSYIKDWERYSDSPFLVYGGDASAPTLVPAPSSELKHLLNNIYSLK